MTRFDIVSPVDGSVFASPEILGTGAAEEVVAAARTAQPDWAAQPLEARFKFCRAFIDAFRRQEERIARELTWQMGRPQAFSPKEVARLVERAETMIDAADRGLAPLDLPGQHGATRRIERVPHGVCLVIAPWNYPYLTAINTIVPALLAGNTVILKPAGQTALTGERLADAFRAAGLPDGVFASALVSHDTVAGWIGARLVDFVSFTGSVRGGTAIEQAAAGAFLPVSLELGGKDPAYVRADADLDFSAAELVDGSFFNSGQSCCGIERIYVDRKVYPEFLERFAQLTEATQKLGDPTRPTTTLGPVVSAHAADGIRRQVADALGQGARILCGDGIETTTGPYLPATVLTGVDHSMAIMTEETFGPTVGIMPVDGDDMAVRLMNDSRYGLSASVWTADRAAGAAVLSRVATGTGFVNRCDYLDPGLAWVGVKDSGRGCSLSELGFHHVTRPKSFYAR
jgi:acyl-CoA reductase-like NAD-dependent aldehyde dehydrogenase